MKTVFKMLRGQLITSVGIAMVIASGFGAFPCTTCNMAFVNWTGLSYGIVNMLVELLFISYAVFRGERLGWGAVMNCVLGGFIIDAVLPFLGFTWLPIRIGMALVGVVMLALGYATIGRQGQGETGSNMMLTALMKQFGLTVGVGRTIMEVTYIIIGLLGHGGVGWFTVVLSLGFGAVCSTVYKLIHYEPTKVVQNYIKLPLTKRTH